MPWTRLARALEAEFDASEEILSLVKQKVECQGNGSIVIITASELKHDIALTKPLASELKHDIALTKPLPARCRKH